LFYNIMLLYLNNKNLSILSVMFQESDLRVDKPSLYHCGLISGSCLHLIFCSLKFNSRSAEIARHFCLSVEHVMHLHIVARCARSSGSSCAVPYNLLLADNLNVKIVTCISGPVSKSYSRIQAYCFAMYYLLPRPEKHVPILTFRYGHGYFTLDDAFWIFLEWKSYSVKIFQGLF
jgi:hypothetical protein